MYSVVARVRKVKQPRGGYIPVRSMELVNFSDGTVLGPLTISPTLAGIVVDAIVRLRLGADPSDVFSLAGRVVDVYGVQDEVKWDKYLKDFRSDRTANTDRSLRAVLVFCDLFQYGFVPAFGPIDLSVPYHKPADRAAIRLMVDRTLLWLDSRIVVKNGFVMPGGYTPVVSRGDGDLLTKDGLWDYKVSKTSPTSYNTLQLLMYWRMGLHSDDPVAFDVPRLGVFNPFLNRQWSISTADIAEDIIHDVESRVIGYGDSDHHVNLLREAWLAGLLVFRSRDVRRWAADIGLYVSSRGAIPQSVQLAYDQTHSAVEDDLQVLRDSALWFVASNGQIQCDTSGVVWPYWYPYQ